MLRDYFRSVSMNSCTRIVLCIFLLIGASLVTTTVLSEPEQTEKKSLFEQINVTHLEAREKDYTVMLKSREFVPTLGIRPELNSIIADKDPAEKIHVMIQFEDIPSEALRESLKKDGAEILSYIPSYTYYASLPVSSINKVDGLKEVRAIFNIIPDDKISPHIRNYGVGEWARNDDGTVSLTVLFFEDVSRNVIINVVKKYGEVVEEPQLSNIWTVKIPEDQIQTFASEDIVQWIENIHPPPTVLLDQSRGTVKADIVQAPPYNLDGTGVTVAQWDSGRIDPNHDDFAGRLIIGDGYPTTSEHSTHVGGIMAGDGTLSGGNQRGIAPNATIRSYEWPNNITELDTETTDAINNNAILSQNSWVWTVDGSNCYKHGDYDSWSKRYDEIIQGVLGDEIVAVFAAGNEENDGDCPPYPWNQTIGPGCTAKNSIGVGAIYSDTLGHTCFSSRGPTDDGRLKPDLVAPGDENGCVVDPRINSTIPGDTYGEKAGTSMAAPHVSGATALIKQQYNIVGMADPKPATYKAILVQTADDLGNPGPDYTYGFGIINIRAAIDLVRCIYPNNALIMNDETDYYDMPVPPSVSTLRVTLAWDDIPGNPAASKQLVNDIDLILISPNQTYHHAYKLDWNNPGNNATTGYNSRDNVEVVEVDNPLPGRWVIKVQGAEINGTQEYSLVAPYKPLPVGGVWVPVDKLALLAPYIASTSTIIAATSATAIYVKRVKRRKKQ